MVRAKQILVGIWRRWRQAPLDIAVGPGTLLQPGFRVDVRAGTARDRVVIGNNSVLQCSITLERATGRITIGNDTFIGTSQLVCAYEINIGSDVLMAWGCTVVDHNSHAVPWPERRDDVRRWRSGLLDPARGASAAKDWRVVPMAPVTIGDKAWIGFNTIIIKGVTIGEGAVVGAGSVVTKTIPPWTVAAGNPARVIRELNEHER